MPANQKKLDLKKQQLSIAVIFTLFVFLLVSSACAPMQVINTEIQQQSLAVGNQNSIDQKDLQINDLIKLNYKPFPMDYNAPVQKWLSYFSKGNGKASMKRYLERSNRYLDYMGDILSENGLPRQLVYMSMTESGFWPYAHSSANAVGYWQFIKPTGQSYDLQINQYVDERRDFSLSTQAAADYLKDLYSEFKDWRLSMAAYNCGAQCVRNAIKKHKSKNFWHLADKKALPPETREYVPKIIAMARISLKPESHGFYNIKYQKPLNYQLVSIQTDSSLSALSNYLRVPHDEMKSLNPKFKTDRIPAGDGHGLRVPDYTRL